MDGLAWAALAAWAAALGCRLLSQSLRNYPHAELERACGERGLTERFQEIVKRDEEAELVASSSAAALAAAASALSALAFARGGRSPAEWAAFAAAALAAVGVAYVLVPWAVSTVAGDRVVMRAWPALAVALKALGLPLRAASWAQTIVRRLSGRKEPEEGEAITGELGAVVEEGALDGHIEAGMSRMLRNLVKLAKEDTRDAMVPRPSFTTLAVDTPTEEARRAFLENGHSRIPVFGDSPDDLLGVVYAKDLLSHLGEGGEGAAGDGTLRPLLREPLLVPESMGLDALLEQMRAERTHMAFVLDEYGGVVGLTTLEDILEKIVGDIADEYDPEEEAKPSFERVDDRTVEAHGEARVKDLNRDLKLDLPDEEDFETVAGFVFGRLNHVPAVGETVEWNGVTITVTEASPRRATRLRLESAEPFAGA